MRRRGPLVEAVFAFFVVRDAFFTSYHWLDFAPESLERLVEARHPGRPCLAVGIKLMGGRVECSSPGCLRIT